MTGPQREYEPDLSTGGFVARVVGGFLEDALVNGAVFISLVVIIAGFVTKQAPWAVAGLAVGGAGMVVPWVGLAKKWASPRMWTVIAVTLVADFALLAAMWTQA